MEIAALLTGKAESSFKNKNLKKINGIHIFLYPCIEANKIKEINSESVKDPSEALIRRSIYSFCVL